MQVDRTLIDGPLRLRYREASPLFAGELAALFEKAGRFDLGYFHTPGRVFSASGYAIPTKPSSRGTSYANWMRQSIA